MIRFIDEVSLAGKRVLVRLDLNTPLNGTAIADTTRIEAALPTLSYILEQGAEKIIIIEPFGTSQRDGG